MFLVTQFVGFVGFVGVSAHGARRPIALAAVFTHGFPTTVDPNPARRRQEDRAR